jgi:hypothetical protein
MQIRSRQIKVFDLTEKERYLNISIFQLIPGVDIEDYQLT